MKFVTSVVLALAAAGSTSAFAPARKSNQVVSDAVVVG